MNELGISLIWLAARVTVVCVVTLLVSALLRRRDQVSTTPTLTGLLLVMALTAALFSPWPRWTWSSEAQPTSVSLSSPAAVDRPADNSGHAEGRVGDETIVAQPDKDSAAAAAWSAFVNAFQRELVSPSIGASASRLRWTGWVAIAAIIAVVVGLMRLLVGWYSVRKSLRRSRPLKDPQLLEGLTILQAEMSCVASVELRECEEISSAATIGWRRPVILLPSSWHDWTDRERRMVLAHELAHIASGDALTWLTAQLGLLLHFYHPLVHWLVGRLRLEQELAADARAAAVTGGPRTYLTTLAELALREPDCRVAWPAQAFLPGRGTLLRRIEMLKNAPARSEMFASLRRRLVIALTVAAGILVAGVRRPESAATVAAEPAPVGAALATAHPAAVQSNGFNFENAAPSTVLMLALRPAQLAARDELKPVLKFVNEAVNAEQLGFGVADIDQFMVTGCPHAEADPPRMSSPVLEIRTLKDVDFGPCIRHAFGETTSQSVGGLTVQSASDVQTVPNADAAWVVDRRTLIQGPFSVISTIAAARKSGTDGPNWLSRTKSIRSGHVAFVLDVTFPRPEIQQTFERNPNPMMGMLAPLWQKTDLVAASVNLSKKPTVAINGWSADEESATAVSNSLTALIPVAQGLLQGSRASAENAPEEARQMIKQGIDLGDAALKTASVSQDGNRVRLTLSADGLGVATMTGLMLPAIQQARIAARRAQSLNNLKQIMLALHIYHDRHGQFPPPVLTGPDGKAKYSWRVAILPFLDQQELYDSYRKNEPWDSPHNRTVLEQIPPVFRHPNLKTGTNASYFAMIGEKTAFGSTDGAGNSIRTFTDGTSNTLMVFEAKRDIPWTKPEDIAYDESKPIPELGGFQREGYNAGLADGSARFISTHVDEELMHNLIRRNDGNPVEFPRR